MRLQKFMANCGIGSRRKCEEIIQEGRVTLNGQTVTQMGTLVDPEKDTVVVDGKAPLRLPEDRIYILLNKPRGTITSVHDQFERETVLDRIGWTGSRIYPVGRLDYDTEGLLLLTNDGELAFEMTHPKHQVEKEYHCIVKGNPEPARLEELKKGVDIGGFMTSPAEVEYVNRKKDHALIRIVIKEGKNRQVRRMFDAIGYPVVFLRRERMGNIRLGRLKPGEWRYLTGGEIKYLKSLTGGGHKRMVNFRKMRIGDLDAIYQDEELRPLITVQPKGRKFAAVMEEDGQILGGVSGYLEEKAAFIQCAVMKDMEQGSLYKDGLIRSLIHFLDLDGTECLFVRENDPVYREIGFEAIRPEKVALDQFSKKVQKELQQDNILWIDLKEFFHNQKC